MEEYETVCYSGFSEFFSLFISQLEIEHFAISRHFFDTRNTLETRNSVFLKISPEFLGISIQHGFEQLKVRVAEVRPLRRARLRMRPPEAF